MRPRLIWYSFSNTHPRWVRLYTLSSLCASTPFRGRVGSLVIALDTKLGFEWLSFPFFRSYLTCILVLTYLFDQTKESRLPSCVCLMFAFIISHIRALSSCATYPLSLKVILSLSQLRGNLARLEEVALDVKRKTYQVIASVYLTSSNQLRFIRRGPWLERDGHRCCC